MRFKVFFIFLVFVGMIFLYSKAQEPSAQTPAPTQDAAATAVSDDGMISSLKFKEADINIVLQAIAQKATKNGKKINIVIAPEVQGTVTIDLKDVPWLTALDAVLKIYDYSYEWIGADILMITTLERLAEKREKETLAAQQEPMETASVKLLFLDAHDVEKMLKPQLTARGKITVLETEPQKGWKARGGFSSGSTAGSSASSTATGDFGRAEREAGAKPRTNTLILSDTKSNLRSLLEAIKLIDILPRQILIKAKIVEVNRNRLKDIGFDYGTGANGVTNPTGINLNGANTKTATATSLGGDVSPSSFTSQSTNIGKTFSTAAGTGPVGFFNAGSQFAFQKYTGTQFEVIMHALEEDVKTNTLSEPSILTLDGQEAYIMVGTKRPIISSTISSSGSTGESSVGINKNLSYYQNLGIELNVVPQICNNNYVNLIIYPSVTSSSSDITATSQIGTATSDDTYPIIDVRETQTQVLLNNGETIAIGGLLKDVSSDSVIKTPILGDIPWLGKLFQRKTHSVEKVDLIIFITVQIVDSSKSSNGSIAAAIEQGAARELKEKQETSVGVGVGATIDVPATISKAQEKAQEKPEMTSTTTAVTTPR